MDGARLDGIPQFGGEMAMFGGWQEPRNATVVASRHSARVRIDDPGFRRILRELPAVAEKMRTIVQERAQATNDG